MSDYRRLEIEASSAADFLHAALTYFGGATLRPSEGTNAAKAAWRAKLAADPQIKPVTIVDQIAAIAVHADQVAHAARKERDEAMARLEAAHEARRQATEEEAYRRRKAQKEAAEEQKLRRGR